MLCLLKILWIPDYQAYSFTILAFDVLCLTCLTFLATGRCTYRAWLGRVLTVGRACCAEIRNHIGSTQKQSRKCLMSPAVGNVVTLVGQWTFPWSSVFPCSGGSNGEIPEGPRMSSYSNMEPVQPQLLVNCVQCPHFFGSSFSPKS